MRYFIRVRGFHAEGVDESQFDFLEDGEDLTYDFLEESLRRLSKANPKARASFLWQGEEGELGLTVLEPGRKPTYHEIEWRRVTDGQAVSRDIIKLGDMELSADAHLVNAAVIDALERHDFLNEPHFEALDEGEIEFTRNTGDLDALDIAMRIIVPELADDSRTSFACESEACWILVELQPRIGYTLHPIVPVSPEPHLPFIRSALEIGTPPNFPWGQLKSCRPQGTSQNHPTVWDREQPFTTGSVLQRIEAISLACKPSLTEAAKRQKIAELEEIIELSKDDFVTPLSLIERLRELKNPFYCPRETSVAQLLIDALDAPANASRAYEPVRKAAYEALVSMQDNKEAQQFLHVRNQAKLAN